MNAVKKDHTKAYWSRIWNGKIRTNLSSALIRHRKFEGMTQAQLAKKLGVASYVVSKWEGCTRFPSRNNFCKIVDLVNKSSNKKKTNPISKPKELSVSSPLGAGKSANLVHFIKSIQETKKADIKNDNKVSISGTPEALKRFFSMVTVAK